MYCSGHIPGGYRKPEKRSLIRFAFGFRFRVNQGRFPAYFIAHSLPRARGTTTPAAGVAARRHTHTAHATWHGANQSRTWRTRGKRTGKRTPTRRVTRGHTTHVSLLTGFPTKLVRLAPPPRKQHLSMHLCPQHLILLYLLPRDTSRLTRLR